MTDERAIDLYFGRSLNDLPDEDFAFELDRQRRIDDQDASTEQKQEDSQC